MAKVTEIVLDHTVDPAAPPTTEAEINLSQPAYSANENSVMIFSIVRTGDLSGVADVDWAFTNVNVFPVSGTQRFAVGVGGAGIVVSTNEVGPTEVGDLTISNVVTVSGDVNHFLGALFQATVTVVDLDNPVQIPPTLFQDYSSNDFAGEAGGLAVNDNWATTVYDYIPRYNPGGSAGEPAIPIIPTYAGAIYQRIVTDLAEMNAAIVEVNAGTVREIYVQRGSNLYTGRARHTQVNYAFFTANAPLWIMAYDSITPANNGEALRTYAPWNDAFADRAVMGQLPFLNCPNVYMVGLSWGQYGIEANDIGSFTNSAYITMFRCHAEGWGGGWELTNANNPTLDPLPFPMLISSGGTLKDSTVGGCLWAGDGSDYTMLYQCNFERSIPKIDGEVKCLDFSSHGQKIVSCSFIDSGTVVQCGLSGNTTGTVVEDCDCHKTKFYDVTGLEDPAGQYGNNEGYVGFKLFHLTDTGIEENFGRFYGNRFSGSRNACPAFDSTPTSGANYFLDSGNGSDPTFPKHRRDFRWNICEDSGKNPFILQFGSNEGKNNRDSVVRNIIYDSSGTGSNSNTGFIYTNGGCEVLLNTHYKIPSTDANISFWNAADPLRDVNYTEFVGNLFIDWAGFTGSLSYLVPATCNFGYNVWADASGAATNLNYPIGIETTEVGLGVMGDFTYIKNKLTNPTQVTIPNIVPTSASLAGLLTITPMSGADQIGSSPLVGIDDVF